MPEIISASPTARPTISRRPYETRPATRRRAARTATAPGELANFFLALGSALTRNAARHQRPQLS